MVQTVQTRRGATPGADGVQLSFATVEVPQIRSSTSRIGGGHHFEW